MYTYIAQRNPLGREALGALQLLWKTNIRTPPLLAHSPAPITTCRRPQ